MLQGPGTRLGYRRWATRAWYEVGVQKMSYKGLVRGWGTEDGSMLAKKKSVTKMTVKELAVKQVVVKKMSVC